MAVLDIGHHSVTSDKSKFDISTDNVLVDAAVDPIILKSVTFNPAGTINSGFYANL